MKILFVVHQFFPHHYTGTERLVLNLSKQLQRLGHYVKVVTYGINETEDFQKNSDFLIKEYEFQGIPVISIQHEIIPADINFAIFNQSIEKIFNKIILKEGFDIIHICHTMRLGSIVRAAVSEKIPLVMTLTDFWLMCPKGIAITNDGSVCTTIDNSRKCIKECYDEAIKDQLINRFNESKEIFQTVNRIVSATAFLRHIFELNNYTSKIELVPFSDDYANVRRNRRNYSETSGITLGFLSTLLPHKGPHVLVDAFNIANVKNMKLKIYGHHFNDVQYYKKLKKLAKNDTNIEFCGEYKYEDMPSILNEIDILIVPSIWWENSPLVLIRALAHNVPAIVSNLGGMTEVIKDGENGFVFEAGNAKALAKIIKKIGESPTILNEIKMQIHHPPRIEEETFEYEKIYFDLIGRK